MIPTVEGLNYGQLIAALKKAGFKEYSQPDGRTYRHESGALLPFPVVSDEEPVRTYHLVASRVTVNDYGIMDARDFDLLLLQISRPSLFMGAKSQPA